MGQGLHQTMPRSSGTTAGYMMTTGSCRNCDTPLQGAYCHACGQPDLSNIRFFGSLVHELFEDVFSFRSRASQTLTALFFRPGFLTCEYIAGRRYRYVPPLRLFLVTSVVCIFFIWLLNLTSGERVIALGVGADSPVEQSAEPVATADRPTVSGLDFTDGQMFVNLPWLSAEQNRQLQARLQVSAKRIEDNPNDFIGDLLEMIPRSMLLLVPLFALMMRVAYPLAGRFYIEHLIHAVHGHAFLFLSILLLVGLEAGASALETTPAAGLSVLSSLLGGLETAIALWMPVYFLLSLKRVYAQGWAMTLFKWSLLSFSYLMLAWMATVSVVVISVLLA